MGGDASTASGIPLALPGGREGEVEPPVPLEVLHPTPPQPTLSLSAQSTAYIAAFKSHLSYGQALTKTALNHSLLAHKVVSEMRVQQEALRVARVNLEAHSGGVVEGFDVFFEGAKGEFARCGGLLGSFPNDLQALHRIPVHRAIAGEDNRFLADYVPEEKLRVWGEGCRGAHEQLVARTMRVAEMVREIKAGGAGGGGGDVDFVKLNQLVQTARECAGKCEGRVGVLERDSSRVESTLADVGSLSTSQARDKVTAVEHLAGIHRDEYLPDLQHLDSNIRTILSHILSLKQTSTHTLLSHLSRISHLQSLIVQVGKEIPALERALRANKGAFEQLLHVHRMPIAWGVGVVEVWRRGEVGKFFLVKANEVANLMEGFRKGEERRRENFVKEIGRYLPEGLIKGLDEPPPKCEILVSGTGTTANSPSLLPKLERKDILDFERLVSSLRGDGSSSQSGGGGDSIEKLRATMGKMVSGSEDGGVGVEWERCVGRSGLSERIRVLEEENGRLRGEVGVPPVGSTSDGVPPPLSRAKTLSLGATDGQALGHAGGVPHVHLPGAGAEVVGRLEETVRVYEGRIRHLEGVMREEFGRREEMTGEEVMRLRSEVESLRERVRLGDAALDAERAKSAQYAARVRELEGVVSRVTSEREESERTLTEKFSSDLRRVEREIEKGREFLGEVAGDVDACASALWKDRVETHEGEEGDEEDGVKAGVANGNTTKRRSGLLMEITEKGLPSWARTQKREGPPTPFAGPTRGRWTQRVGEEGVTLFSELEGGEKPVALVGGAGGGGKQGKRRWSLESAGSGSPVASPRGSGVFSPPGSPSPLGSPGARRRKGVE
ncbi:hypothetical protein HDV00_011577, partial [Rhizophlyctis rosea]